MATAVNNSTVYPTTEATAIPNSTTEGNHSNRSGSNLQFLVIVVLVLLIAAAVGLIVWFKRKKMKHRKSWISQIKSGENIPEARNRVSLVKVLPSPRHLQSTPRQTNELRSSRIAPGTQPVQPVQFSVEDLSLLEVLKIGKQGKFYRAKITRGNCKGHRLVTCKLTMRAVSRQKLQMEIGIMNKLGYHKNIIQLLEWNISQEPYILIMEHVGSRNLKTFLQNNRPQLSSCKDLQTQLTLSAYFISLGMEHIASKKIAHRDLAARNILVGRFPQECKIAEFSLAADLSNTGAVKCKKGRGVPGIPFRWYPPEFFTDGIYSLHGDVWAFGILLWELETLGSSPYPEFETAEQVVLNVCSGYKMKKPSQCRDEIYEVMDFCWIERHEERPTFSDITKYLEDLVENDADYIQVEDCIEERELVNSTPWTIPQSASVQNTYVRGWFDSV
ncbi:tyrosine kinase receptor Cad96Ca [Hemiscyllium ocellatum]|uniref:tyrosine kinase receptor Cad96Ca n=1 Tax=Hemiscyllium ocellatum TaxID=170820 RepID=UPI0029671A31|nr:tyrosine kinase receptor Cad96Ca [Hemiscyllium ocellatum]